MKQIINHPPRSLWPSLTKRPAADLAALEPVVQPILRDVQSRGDEALREYSKKFDHVSPVSFLVSDDEISLASSRITAKLSDAILLAKKNIETFHLSQRDEVNRIETMPGVVCWRKSVPIQKVGFYIPGGTAPLFSTLLMLGVPALIAGCPDIVVCTPPGADGSVHPAILYTADLLGIRQIFKVGGAQAIAAMAYGTETIPAVYKIFGPGNAYVTAAKQIVSTDGIAIDLPAGPSELAIICDDTANPAFVAADLLSQAEHGIDSQVLLVSWSENILHKVLDQIYVQLAGLPRQTTALQSIQHSKAILLPNPDQSLEFINLYAPEHLILACEDAHTMADRVINSGSVFIGHFSCESAGDYASGTNHTLPTAGFARAYSGVSLDSFVKKITFQHITPQGLEGIGPAIESMADAENLHAHRMAVSLRLEYIQNSNIPSST